MGTAQDGHVGDRDTQINALGGRQGTEAGATVLLLPLPGPLPRTGSLCCGWGLGHEADQGGLTLMTSFCGLPSTYSTHRTGPR